MFAELVRGSGKQVILAANKCEGRAAEPGLYEAYSLGLGEPLPISAEHGIGIGEVTEIIEQACRARDGIAEIAEGDAVEAETPHPLRIAIVGRPNVGKSTLVNALLGEERMITGPEAGITRDAIASALEWRGQVVAAVRHRGAQAQDAGRGTRRGALGRRCAEGDPLRRGRGAAARRRAAVREAGSADRRSDRAGGPRAGHRRQQMGPRARARQAPRRTAREVPAPLAAGQGRGAGAGLGADRAGPRQADAGGARGRRLVEPQAADACAQSLAAGRGRARIRLRPCRDGASSSDT